MNHASGNLSGDLPPLRQDRSFWGMTATQFLGAFNDNLFKQLVLLICVDHALRGSADYQARAMALFAIPFVLFSGLGGYLSDRFRKRQIVVLCKVAEIVVMACGCAAFLTSELVPLFVVLFLMSTQSAFFGPSKYGILPELFRESDLPQANGVIQMTTFMAIIFGMAFAGLCKDWFENQLWVTSLVCVGIAMLGTLTSLLVRRTPVARSGLPFTVSSLGINRETWKLLRSDRPLFGVLMVSSLFWFVGGVVQPTVNAFGKLQMGYGDTHTSILAACMGVGIALGCVLAGRLSAGTVSFRLVRVGATGIVICLFVMASWCWLRETVDCFTPADALEWPARGVLTLLGVFAGLFVVPLQVFLQARPPESQKGRMIGAMNLINWIGIVLSAAFFGFCQKLLSVLQIVDGMGKPAISWIFAAVALVMLPIAVMYRPRVPASAALQIRQSDDHR